MPPVNPPPWTNIITGTSRLPFGRYRSRRWRYLSAPSPAKYVRFVRTSTPGISAARIGEAGAKAASRTNGKTQVQVFMALELCPMADCLFCKDIGVKIPWAVVYEDDRVLAFNDIGPQAPTHVLIVPKRHIPTLND